VEDRELLVPLALEAMAAAAVAVGLLLLLTGDRGARVAAAAGAWPMKIWEEERRWRREKRDEENL
jgi:hypothetical protein